MLGPDVNDQVINQVPDVKPFLGRFFGSVKGEATVAHHGEGAQRDIRNLRQVLRMRPIFIRHVVLNVYHHPIPRHIPVIDTEGRRKNWFASMRRRRVLQGPQKEREEFF